MTTMFVLARDPRQGRFLIDGFDFLDGGKRWVAGHDVPIRTWEIDSQDVPIGFDDTEWTPVPGVPALRSCPECAAVVACPVDHWDHHHPARWGRPHLTYEAAA